MTEEWRGVGGWPYEVSSLGRIRRTKPYRTTFIGRVLKGTLNKDGYLQVSLCNDGRRVSRCIHQIVCEAWHGPCPSPEHQAAHWNGNKLDNVPTNLRWTDAIGNSRDDRERLDEAFVGASNGNSKLTEDQIREIRARLERGATISEISDAFGISRGYVWKIGARWNWKHL